MPLLPAFGSLHESVLSCYIKHTDVELRTTEINSEDIDHWLDELAVPEKTDAGTSRDASRKALGSDRVLPVVNSCHRPTHSSRCGPQVPGATTNKHNQCNGHEEQAE